MATTDKHVALLRGINVGGKNTLRMKDLAALFATVGCLDVQTYIQSGNVVFCANPKTANGIADKISHQIAAKFGLTVPVVLRTQKELQSVVRSNPFLKNGAEVASLHVVFLADAPERKRIAALDADRSPGDSFKVRGREIYLHLPNGAAKSKLTAAYFDSSLNTISTQRNWRTVLQLAEMLAHT